MFKSKVIDRIMENLKKCTGLHRLKHRSLCRVDLPRGQVGLTSSKANFHVESESRFNSDENCFQFITKFLDLYHTKSTLLALMKGQLNTMTYVLIYANLCIFLDSP